MQTERLNELLDKEEKGLLTTAESRELDIFYDSFESRSDYTDELSYKDKIQLKERLYAKIRSAGMRYRWNKKFGASWIPVAAASLVLAVIAFSIWGNLFMPSTPQSDTQTGLTNLVIQPGKNQAKLTLADGTVMILDTNHNTILIQEDGIRYDQGEYLAHQSTHSGTEADGSSQMLQLDVPNGGIYNVVLSDGTRIWLNSGTRLRYPLRFEKGERRIELQGEGYFDVSHVENDHGNRVPFLVHSGLQLIEVLGTKFNVQAYPEDPIFKTTLLEGSVNVYQAGPESWNKQLSGRSILLNPHEQAVFNLDQGTFIRKKVDTRSELAWKNGYFHFDNENLRSIMAKISRWYDVDVDYQTDPDQIALIGIIPRAERIESVLNSLEKTGEIKFKVKERRISVMK